jgi:acetyl esterase/lipase
MGDNAGGTLAAAVARRARDHGAPAIALQIRVYPLLDYRMASASYHGRGNKMLICPDDVAFFWSQYLPGSADRPDPDASPGLAEDLRGLPPALIVVAEFDVRPPSRRVPHLRASTRGIRSADNRVQVQHDGARVLPDARCRRRSR